MAHVVSRGLLGLLRGILVARFGGRFSPSYGRGGREPARRSGPGGIEGPSSPWVPPGVPFRSGGLILFPICRVKPLGGSGRKLLQGVQEEPARGARRDLLLFKLVPVGDKGGPWSAHGGTT
jgi:hypothetical protein